MNIGAAAARGSCNAAATAVGSKLTKAVVAVAVDLPAALTSKGRVMGKRRAAARVEATESVQAKLMGTPDILEYTMLEAVPNRGGGGKPIKMKYRCGRRIQGS